MQSAYWNIEITPSSFFPPPHSGILFLLLEVPYQGGTKVVSFRPLIRGFFFYEQGNPHYNPDTASFRPLIRGFFFYLGRKEGNYVTEI